MPISTKLSAILIAAASGLITGIPTSHLVSTVWNAMDMQPITTAPAPFSFALFMASVACLTTAVGSSLHISTMGMSTNSTETRRAPSPISLVRATRPSAASTPPACFGDITLNRSAIIQAIWNADSAGPTTGTFISSLIGPSPGSSAQPMMMASYLLAFPSLKSHFIIGPIDM